MFVLALIQAVVVLENGKHLVKVSTTLSTHCLLISLKSKTIIAGNHVGDWEHVSLRLQRGQPVEMYLGVHRYTLLISLYNVVTNGPICNNFTNHFLIKKQIQSLF